ncbi:hypothetical protein RDI58_025567 [Solanum bulbocastanum]|uniref:Uncharacterized protein n=1 Tax=Solanum bulbocastanum TaxID=147425 RepID=A0AAN8T386_SOLBU
MWPNTSGVVIEPLEPKVMLGRPPKCRRKAKNEPLKKLGWDNLGNQAEAIHQCLANHQSQASHHCLANHQAQISHQCLANHQAQVSHPYLVIKAVLCVLILQLLEESGNLLKAEAQAQVKALTEAQVEAQVEAPAVALPGTSGERVISLGAYRDATPTNIDIGYKPRGLKWNGGDAVTASQLQHMSQSRKNISSSPRNA